jgi:hypothetical protein
MLRTTPTFRITLLILISWTLLFFIYPIIAAIVGLFASSVLIFYIAFNGMRKGVIMAGFGLRGFIFERSLKPFMFWFFILLYVFVGVLVCGLAIFGILKNF